MGRLRSLVRKDLLHASRENSLLYALLFPLVIAAILRLFLPSVEGMEVTFALDRSVPDGMAAKIRSYGRVEYFDGIDAVKERVLRFDDVPGIYLEGKTYAVVLEGNEESYVRELPGLVLGYAGGDSVTLQVRAQSIGRKTSLSREYGTILVALTCIAMGGLAVGLSIVDDRESRTLRALSVTPLKTGEYLLGKSVFGLSSAFGLSLASVAIIMGGGVDYLRLVPPLAASLLWGLATGLAMGYICANQLTAIALLKLLALGLLGIPIAAMFVPETLKWALYPFPNYWSFEA